MSDAVARVDTLVQPDVVTFGSDTYGRYVRAESGVRIDIPADAFQDSDWFYEMTLRQYLAQQARVAGQTGKYLAETETIRHLRQARQGSIVEAAAPLPAGTGEPVQVLPLVA